MKVFKTNLSQGSIDLLKTMVMEKDGNYLNGCKLYFCKKQRKRGEREKNGKSIFAKRISRISTTISRKTTFSSVP